MIQNPALAQILAEARKYNLFVFLTQQYFGQIEKSIRDAIFSNVANYYVFRVSEEDARALEGNLTIELPKEALLEEKEIGNKENELRVRILTSLNTRECLLRLSSNGQILPGIKARTMDFHGAAKKRSVELKTYSRTDMPSKFQESVASQVSFAELPKQQNAESAHQIAVVTQPEIQAPRPASTPSRHPRLVDFLANQSGSFNDGGRKK